MIVTARAMVRKELHQIMRDRRTLLILVFVPALFLLLYGYALNFDIKNTDLAVEDQDGSTAAASSSRPSPTPATSPTPGPCTARPTSTGSSTPMPRGRRW